jgi:hypothetical protein
VKRRWSTFLAAAVMTLCVGAWADDNDAIKELPITEYDRDHWAFKKIERPTLPITLKTIENGIDAFVLQKLHENGLDFAPESERATLLRRLTLDLTGLPPTEEELAAFLSDASPLAYDKQVDRLLASPQYGERAATFWLDLARFADTDGFEHDLVRKNAWQYRDWVISAFNRDLAYDEFAKAQLAGDETENAAERIATMFCLSGPDMPDLNDQHLRRHDRLNELTSTVGSVFLGLQMGCAQCHDHKYDPLSQADFYRMRAIFEPAIPDLQRDKPYNVFEKANNSSEPRFWIRGDHTRPGPSLVAAFPRIADRPDASNGTPPTRTAFANWLASEENPLFARVAANRIWQQHFGKGIFGTPSDAGLVGLAPSHEDLLNWLAVTFREGDWSIKSLRRTIVTSKTYRQTSRRGDQEISRWQERLDVDPENTLYSRYPRRRLEGEAIRDSMLFAAGEINLAQRGPGVMPPLPKELVSTLLRGHWSESKNKADHVRRSIYLFSRRNLRYPIFEAFDRPDANESCPSRNVSITASQALILLNGEFAVEISQKMASKAYDDAELSTSDHALRRGADALFRRILQRLPSRSEQEKLNQFLIDQPKLIAADHPDWVERKVSVAALADISLALLNSSEFLFFE